MSANPDTHLWVRGGRRAVREAVVSGLRLPPGLAPALDAHRRLRGPYSAAGALLRAIVPDVLARDRELVRKYDIELLSAAPELSAIVPDSRETLTSMALPAERTRFHARLRTLRTSHGLVEFVRDGLPADRPLSLVVEDVEHAEHTDVEFLSVLLRRIDPGRLTVVLCSAADAELDPLLATALAAYARVVQVRAAPGAAGRSEAGDAELARRYAELDCVSDEPALRSAYEALDEPARRELHDRRADELDALDQQSLRLGAIPYHREHGGDPAGAGVHALYAAMDHSLVLGFYDATVEYGERGIALVDPRQDERQWWMFAVELGLALSLLSRTREAERLYDEARLVSALPAVHMAAAYSTAMLYTRHNDPADRDERKAKSWLNAAIATASLVAEPVSRAFQSAFYKNGLALVEVNLGEPAEALRLVTECIDALDRDLTPDQHRLHRSALKNDRGRVYAGLGRLDEALADYTVVIREDPNHAEHYLERGNILRRLGRYEEAFADYGTAMRLSPPFPEVYYNRGDLYALVGDWDSALADYGYVLELDPDFVDAYVNRAGIRLDAGELETALDDATAGLARDPDNPYLHAVAGRVNAERERHAEAMTAVDRALEADPDLAAASRKGVSRKGG
jgi:tetratricopeptide (TPR) repeat protein